MLLLTVKPCYGGTNLTFFAYFSALVSHVRTKRTNISEISHHVVEKYVEKNSFIKAYFDRFATVLFTQDAAIQIVSTCIGCYHGYNMKV